MGDYLKKAGFTLTEVMIAVVLIGIIAGLAVPTYFTTIEQSRSNEAKSNLFTIWMAQKIYKLNNNKFYPQLYSNTISNLTSINSDLNVELSTQYYTYNITANTQNGNNANFSAVASRSGSSKTFTISVTGSDTAPPVVSEAGTY